MAKVLLVLLTATSSPQCHGARVKSGAIMSSEAAAKTGKTQCIITTKEKELGLVWKFGTESKGCRTACLSQGIYSSDKRNAAFEAGFDASFENNRCHCRDKHGVDKLPLFRSKRLCTARVCWEFHQQLMGLYKKTNLWQVEPTCGKCDDDLGPKCDDVNLGPTFSLPDLKKKQDDGTLPPGAGNVIRQFVDEETTTTAKPKKPTTTTATELKDAEQTSPQCPPYVAHDDKTDVCIDEETDLEVPEECCSRQDPAPSGQESYTKCPPYVGHDEKTGACIDELTDGEVPDECCAPLADEPIGRLEENSLQDEDDEDDIVPEYHPELE